MPSVKLISVNTGQPQDIRLGRHHSVSGIDKRSVPGRVDIGRLGLEGDHIMNRKYHGGPDQAVYLYSLEDYAAFSDAVGQNPAPGLFGENLTVEGLESASVRIGTRLSIGTLLLEVTAPRIPCATFAAHMGDETFVKIFRQRRRPGLYTRVLGNGSVGAGDLLQLHDGPEMAPTAGEEFELFHDPNPSRAELERSLAAPIAVRSRQDYLERLGKL